MEKESFVLADRECIVYREDDPEFLLIRPIEKDHTKTLDLQAQMMFSGTDHSILFLAFKIENWNEEMSPWYADPVFGTESFGSGAAGTLGFIENELFSAVRARYDLDLNIPVILGGYSLAGLFSLWSAYQTAAFSGIAAASPSVWFPGWKEYAETHTPQTNSVYLSLGDKEERTKNSVMASVGECIRSQQALLSGNGINNTLEWNKGNHFVDADRRTAKGFLWCLNALSSGMSVH